MPIPKGGFPRATGADKYHGSAGDPSQSQPTTGNPNPNTRLLAPFGGGDIGDAVDHMWHGGRVARAGWNGKGMWLALQKPDANSKMWLPYVYMSTVTGQLVPWLCSQTDLLATDWRSVE